MKIGISTASLFMRLYNEDAVALISEWGVGTAEVFLTFSTRSLNRSCSAIIRAFGRMRIPCLKRFSLPQTFSARNIIPFTDLQG